jgi:hypothetical protein
MIGLLFRDGLSYKVVSSFSTMLGLQLFAGDFINPLSGAGVDSVVTRIALPTFDHRIDVNRIELDAIADPARALGCD